jgi:hypothetical protein
MRFWKVHAGVLALALVLLDASAARAAYVLTPFSGGFNTITVAPGGSFSLDLVLTSEAADEHNSAIFRVVFSEPGLIYSGFTWQSPYTLAYDDSKPNTGFDILLDAATLSGPAYPDGVVDIELSNVVEPGTFTTGTLVRLDLAVPADYSGAPTVYISAAPDTIANGFDIIDTAAGGDFTLNVPEPAAWTIVSLVGAVALLRRRAGRGSA